MWFPNWLQERRNAARSAQVERPPALSTVLEAHNIKIAP